MKTNGLHLIGLAALAAALVLPSLGHAADASDSLANVPLQRPEIFLTWDAPFGSPGATDQLRRGCKTDSGPHADTLYLSYRLRKAHDELVGIEASLFIHAQFEDTLSGAWRAAEFPNTPPWLQAEFPTDDREGFRAGWETHGVGFPLYFKETSRAILRMIFAVRADQTAPIKAGEIFTFSRLIIDRHSPEFADCDQPLCIEWVDGVFTFGIGKGDERGELSRRCFVSVNSPQGIACSKYRQIAERRGYLTQAPKPGDKY